MFKHYLLTAWRHILKNRLFSAINVFGLAVGMMSCILILLFVKDELSYDRWIPESEKIVRLHSAFVMPDRPPFRTVRAAGRMMEGVKAFASAEVEEGVRLIHDDGFTLIKNGEAFSEAAFYADGSFFRVFDLPFAHGDAATSFNAPLDLVISEEIAIKYFGRTNVVGETVTLCCMPSNPMDFRVSGVIRDMPQATHFDIDFLIRMEPSMFDGMPNILNTWNSVNTYTYFKLREGKTVEDLQARLEYWLNNKSPFLEQNKKVGMTGDSIKVTDTVQHNVMPLEKLHLYARTAAGNLSDLSAMGDINVIYTFTAVAALILIIASINFMNLSTARAAKRAREVALRKVMGASRLQVASQFLGEAVAIAILALIVALVGVEVFLPLYSQAIGRELGLDMSNDLIMVFSFFGVAVLIGLVSGSYPAAVLSRFMPARILKANRSSDTASRGGIRGALVVFQFAVSICLAVCTAVVYGQTVYAQRMDLGYSHAGKLALGNINVLGNEERARTLQNRLEAVSGVKNVVFSSDVPSQDRENNTRFHRLDVDRQSSAGSSAVLNYYSVGFDFFEAYDVTPVAGRLFSEAFGTDAITPIPAEEDRIGAASVIVNEAGMRALGFSSASAAIGSQLQANIWRAGRHNVTIVGVVPDLYFRSIKHGIRPSVYFVNSALYRSATISFETNDIATLQREIGQIWRETAPLTPMSLEFVSDMIQAQYDAEERQANLFAAFAALAIFVACLGLYGLAAFTAEQRTKEIGVRKVLGATVVDVVRLLVWQFSRPVLLANLIAWPVAWYYMSDWLEGFEYRLESSFLLISAILASVIALLVAWTTVASRALKVAKANPIHALRYE